MKYSRLIGTAWIILAFYDLFFGFHHLYQYSTPGVFWIYMIPVWITFSKIFIGAIGFLNGISIFRGTELRLTLPIAVTLFLYIVVDFIKIGIELIPDSGSNLLYFGLALLTLKLKGELTLTKFKELSRRRTLIYIAIGLIPYFLNSWTTYDWFNFLH
tara:strand:+ start:14669 stop:15139 length:471 start_codon:yes stop_codon:yes gene_type:complete